MNESSSYVIKDLSVEFKNVVIFLIFLYFFGKQSLAIFCLKIQVASIWCWPNATTYPSQSNVFSLLIQNLNKDCFKIYSTRLSTSLETKNMCDFGHKSLVTCDATFGINKYKFLLLFLKLILFFCILFSVWTWY